MGIFLYVRNAFIISVFAISMLSLCESYPFVLQKLSFHIAISMLSQGGSIEAVLSLRKSTKKTLVRHQSTADNKSPMSITHMGLLLYYRSRFLVIHYQLMLPSRYLLVRSFCGLLNTSAAEPVSTTSPRYMKMTWSATRMACCRLCDTMTMV